MIVYDRALERFLEHQAITIYSDPRHGFIIWYPWFDHVEVWEGNQYGGTGGSQKMATFRNYRSDAAIREAIDYLNTLPKR